ncbi:hypothetical protein GJ744_011101 [Endocarpon pusillum]|uniref:Uncharacterized protein n=1 Tax=Endocarpon pusillum TaxID=364733 RepID=A0A8H7AD80_9EURO|nr:hypothetical protein GJ744_011101 [Endocarpon pusillum]
MVHLPANKPTLVRPSPTVAELLSPATTFVNLIAATPFIAIKALFDYLVQNPAGAEALNDTYALRGIFKTAATKDPALDQKLTIDLLPTRIARIPSGLQAELEPHGLAATLSFFDTIVAYHAPLITASLSAVTGCDLALLHGRTTLTSASLIILLRGRPQRAITVAAPIPTTAPLA